MSERVRFEQFEAAVLVHLDAAHNLARWLTRDDVAAQDVVQEAVLRAFRYFGGQHGASPKAWFMAVVRNASLDWLRRNRRREQEDAYDDETHGVGTAAWPAAVDTPEAIVERAADARWLCECIESLPRDYREVIVLRELEELSYKEISAIVEVPIGTVMSRLSRGRDLLQQRMREARARKTS